MEDTMGDKIGIAFNERSTWVSIIGFLSLFGVNIAPEYSKPIVEIAIGLSSILGLFLKRNSNAK
jgi:hypothetical protein